ncbi:replication factor C large subunit [Candidatus Woesearchaeota archaeon]|nr:replication factor C large subunit [Candidatus Woesearchaeota archaeon]
MIKHNPEKLNEIVGQDTKKILLWLESPRKKALLIHGPTGTGKTSAVYALADDKNLELLELNSSDLRNKEKIKNIIGIASQQQSLFGKNKLILIDEVDGISGRYDYGGLAELNKVIDKTKYPIILTANDVSDSKFTTLRKKCELVEFVHVDYLKIFELLKTICERDKVKFDEKKLKNIARKNNGDVRASLLDLRASIVDGKVSEEGDDREYVREINEALKLVFKSKDVNVLLNAFSNVDEDLDEILLWLDENLDKEYSGNDLLKAYEMLSRADVFRGRIIKRQHHRFLVYQSALMSAGVGLSKSEKREGYFPYRRSTRILKMWIAKNRNSKRKSIAEKLARKTYFSTRKAYKEFDNYVKFLKDEKVASELELDDDEIKYVEDF